MDLEDNEVNEKCVEIRLNCSFKDIKEEDVAARKAVRSGRTEIILYSRTWGQYHSGR